jgi:hypothetical protein
VETASTDEDKFIVVVIEGGMYHITEFVETNDAVCVEVRNEDED